jgi:micrococcal nuclease
VEGKSIRLEKDISEKDKYGRILGYVYVDNVFVNAEIVRFGYTHAKAYPPDIKHHGT